MCVCVARAQWIVGSVDHPVLTGKTDLSDLAYYVSHTIIQLF